ncbi:MAG: elongation factor P maturation arginine rhamnosyltransferase EarP [Pseudomonadota bacterium]|nr:elongation factor P maturation arginine rhamnosyltransferase EarP [Pseudomonadota bacterium]
MLWDIFCRVVDNHGDIGVCWRLARNLADRGESVRLWADDASALTWMAPAGAPGVRVETWRTGAGFPPPGDVVIEAFGCELTAAFVAGMAGQASAACWINLEYLTAESYARRSHGLLSPVLAGPGAGLSKRFFYPGFGAGSGGLLRESNLLDRQSRFDRGAWLDGAGVDPRNGRIVSLFCYQPDALPRLLQQLQRGPELTQLLVTAGRATAAVRALLQADAHKKSSDGAASTLSVTYLPLLTQHEYDHLLWSCDFNFVRGEDSLVRALWAGRPFCWQPYPQHDGAHHAKLDAFLDWLDAPPGWRHFHRGWNAVDAELPPIDPRAWLPCAQQGRARLLGQDDLVTQLLRFVGGVASRPGPAVG